MHFRSILSRLAPAETSTTLLASVNLLKALLGVIARLAVGTRRVVEYLIHIRLLAQQSTKRNFGIQLKINLF